MKPTGIVMCGGLSSRMGQNKALLKLGNFTIIEHVIEVLKPLCNDIILSVNNHDLDFLPYRKIKDIFDDIGPISGIYSTLMESETDENFIVSCDTPFINKELLSLFQSEAKNYDIVLPVYKNKIQPITGLFKKRVLWDIELQLEMKNYVPVNIFEKCNTKFIDIDDSVLPNADRIFLNINKTEDYQQALRMNK
jgi:molybdopterin-guanine dinucleotide biosynthesis protein A